MGITQIRRMLENYVARNVDRSTGVLFSGGFDSSLLCLLAQKKYPHVPAYTIRVGDHNQDVVAKSVRMAKMLSIQLWVIDVSKDEYIKGARQVLPLLKDGVVDFDLPAVYAGVKKIRRFSRCLLSGFGCDELMGDRSFEFQGLDEAWRHVRSSISVHRRIARLLAVRLTFPFAQQSVVVRAREMSGKERKGKSLLRAAFSELSMEMPVLQESQDSQIPSLWKRMVAGGVGDR